MIIIGLMGGVFTSQGWPIMAIISFTISLILVVASARFEMKEKARSRREFDLRMNTEIIRVIDKISMMTTPISTLKKEDITIAVDKLQKFGAKYSPEATREVLVQLLKKQTYKAHELNEETLKTILKRLLENEKNVRKSTF